jgi:hypothetical protein
MTQLTIGGTGLTEAQRAGLKAMGAIEGEGEDSELRN